ncbi:retrovirus-related pol polyprotein from transposon TNT 1-94 [Tanacetum coccineum]
MMEVKILMALAEDNDAVSKKGARNADDTKVSIPGVERPWLSEAEGFIFPNHDTGRILPAESQRNTTDPPVVVTDSSTTDYDSADESSVCNTPLPLLKKLDGAEPYERTDHRTCDHVEYVSTMNMSKHLKNQGGSSSRSRTPRPSKHFFPLCIHCGFSDHLSDDCVNYLICDICGSYDHDTHGDFSKKSSPYTPEQNGVAKRKNRTLIEAVRTMLSGSVFSKQYWTEAVATACYTQNKSTIVKRHLKTPYENFRKRIPNIKFLHVFGCPVYIYNHKDHLRKFDEKADDGYLLGYSLVSKAFRVFNTRRQ